jgi:predicted sulfurtransferase
MQKIILFYKYVTIVDPVAEQTRQRSLCTELGLKGRIILGTEGINGTLGGSEEAVASYLAVMRADERFADIDFKESLGGAEHFPKLKVMVKREIVNLGIDPAVLSADKAAPAISPAEAHELMTRAPEDLVILDTRNNYESRIGTFKGAVACDTLYFREFPAFIEKNREQFENKQVLMACTGGIRCERASAYLQELGIAKSVKHIRGGIHRYVEQFPDGHFRGKNYVFDSRIVQRVTEDILATCDACATPADDYYNCVNASCNKQLIFCQSCAQTVMMTCSQHCTEQVEAGNVFVRKTQCRDAIQNDAQP